MTAELTLAVVLALAAKPECGAAHGVPPDRLAAIATHESGRNALAIGVNPEPSRNLPGAVLRPSTAAEAAATARELLRQERRIDLGLMQISHVNLSRHGLTVEAAFDACRSMAAGAAHIAADLRAVWGLAHRRYNCGGTDCGLSYATSIERVHARISAEAALAPATAPAPPAAAPTPPPSPRGLSAFQRVRPAAASHPSTPAGTEAPAGATTATRLAETNSR
jgi:type IV secretion system protein VirB1